MSRANRLGLPRSDVECRGFFTGDAAFGEIGTEPEKTIRGQLERFDAFLREIRNKPHTAPNWDRRRPFGTRSGGNRTVKRICSLGAPYVAARRNSG